MSTTLQIGAEVSDTDAEGPGRRYAVWFQGCPLRCPGCCNPELLPFSGGQAVCVNELLQTIGNTPGIEGISLLGGEPFAHAEGAATLAEGVQALGLTVMIYTGFTLQKLRAKKDPAIDRLIAASDLIVDGPYDAGRPDTTRTWIGSTNQTLHFLTDRYRPDDPQFRQAQTVELRLRDGVLTINGWPWTGQLP